MLLKKILKKIASVLITIHSTNL